MVYLVVVTSLRFHQTISAFFTCNLFFLFLAVEGKDIFVKNMSFFLNDMLLVTFVAK